jgi:hypothetical protein
MIAKGRKEMAAPDHRVSQSVHDRLRESGLSGTFTARLSTFSCSELTRAGLPRSVAMKMTGHQADSVFRRYDIVSPDYLRIRLNVSTRSPRGSVTVPLPSPTLTLVGVGKFEDVHSGKLEAPPGLSILLTRFACWSALIPRLRRCVGSIVPKLFAPAPWWRFLRLRGSRDSPHWVVLAGSNRG